VPPQGGPPPKKHTGLPGPGGGGARRAAPPPPPPSPCSGVLGRPGHAWSSGALTRGCPCGCHCREVGQQVGRQASLCTTPALAAHDAAGGAATGTQQSGQEAATQVGRARGGGKGGGARRLLLQSATAGPGHRRHRCWAAGFSLPSCLNQQHGTPLRSGRCWRQQRHLLRSLYAASSSRSFFVSRCVRSFSRSAAAERWADDPTGRTGSRPGSQCCTRGC